MFLLLPGAQTADSAAFSIFISLQQDLKCEISACLSAAADLWVERVGPEGTTCSEQY